MERANPQARAIAPRELEPCAATTALSPWIWFQHKLRVSNAYVLLVSSGSPTTPNPSHMPSCTGETKNWKPHHFLDPSDLHSTKQMRPSGSQSMEVSNVRWQPCAVRSELVTGVWTLGEATVGVLLPGPGCRDNVVGPGGPRSGFMLLLSLGISPGSFPYSSVKLTPYFVINPCTLKRSTEQYTHLQGGLQILLGKVSSRGRSRQKGWT